MDYKRLDIWFTQDAIDADNLPATRLTGIYAIKMLKKYDSIHIWCDVLTLRRSLGRPRLIQNGMKIDSRIYFERIENSQHAENDSSAIDYDTELCQAYDSCLLLLVLQNTVREYKNIHVHMVLGNFPKERSRREPSATNNFLFVDLKHKVANTPEKVITVQSKLERISGNFENIYQELSREPNEDGGENVFVCYNKNLDTDFEARRNRFRQYIQNQVEIFGVLKNENFNENIFCSLQDATNMIINVSSDINVFAFAPLTNTLQFVTSVEDKLRIKAVIGDLLTLEPLDNYLSMQWNEWFDLQAACDFFTEIQKWTHKCMYFFTPTQCFKKSKNSQFSIQEHILKASSLVHASCMINTDNTNVYLGYQKLWNLSKSNVLKVSDSDQFQCKGEPIFDPLAILVLLETNLRSSISNPYISRFVKCKVDTKENGRSLNVLLDSGILNIPDVRNKNCIKPDIIQSYLTAYNVEFDFHKVSKISQLFQELHMTNEKKIVKMEIERSLNKMSQSSGGHDLLSDVSGKIIGVLFISFSLLFFLYCLLWL